MIDSLGIFYVLCWVLFVTEITSLASMSLICNDNNNTNQTTVNWAKSAMNNTGFVDTDVLPGSYPYRKYMVCLV